jgi:hypothetical protein
MLSSPAKVIGRKVGYLIAIVINLIMLVFFNLLSNFHFRFITENFNDCLWIINISILATILANFAFFVFDPKWFVSFAHIFLNIISIIFLFVFIKVFPFDFDYINESINHILKICFIFGIFGTSIAIIVEFVKLVTSFIHFEK